MPKQTGNGENGDELKAQLDAYARTYLEPDPDATARIRGQLMAAARTRLAPEPSRRAGWAFGLFGRRPVIAFVGAALSLAVLAGGALAASQAGGPLYGARLWVEEVTLPTDANARAQAELARLQARLEEASAAANQGNGAAVKAALEAYRQIVDDSLAVTGGDLSRDERLEQVLELHQVVLQALAGQLPDQASDAVQRALERSDHALDAIAQDKAQGKPSAPGGTRGGSGESSPKPSHSPGPPTDHPGKGPPAP